MSAKIRLKTRERLSLFSDLSTMLTAGIPLLEAVESLETDAKGNLQEVLRVLRRTLVNGEPLSRAMEQLPQAFDAVNINLVRAAETGGTLEETLSDIVKTTKKDLVFSDNLRTTMIYPAFVMVVFLAIVILMLTFVIPRVAKVFSSMRVHMPPITRAMITVSAFFTSHWLIIIIICALLVAGLVMLIRMNSRAFIRIILRLPGLRTLGHNIDFTRFTRSFGLLMAAGVPIEDSLRLSERVVQNKEIIDIVRQMRRNVTSGNNLSSGLREYGSLIPPIMSRSIETAESSGTLEKTMQNLSEYFDGQVTESLKVVSSLVEPVLLIVVGLMVGTLMITIIAPIYNLISQINPTSN